MHDTRRMYDPFFRDRARNSGRGRCTVTRATHTGPPTKAMTGRSVRQLTKKGRMASMNNLLRQLGFVDRPGHQRCGMARKHVRSGADRRDLNRLLFGWGP